MQLADFIILKSENFSFFGGKCMWIWVNTNFIQTGRYANMLYINRIEKF